MCGGDDDYPEKDKTEAVSLNEVTSRTTTNLHLKSTRSGLLLIDHALIPSCAWRFSYSSQVCLVQLATATQKETHTTCLLLLMLMVTISFNIQETSAVNPLAMKTSPTFTSPTPSARSPLFHRLSVLGLAPQVSTMTKLTANLTTMLQRVMKVKLMQPTSTLTDTACQIPTNTNKLCKILLKEQLASKAPNISVILQLLGGSFYSCYLSQLSSRSSTCTL